MFAAGLLQRRLSLSALRPISQKNYSETKSPNLYMWGGGLGKLQGGLKEEEYFTTVNLELIGKMRGKKAIAEFLPNWDEYHKAITNDALYNTALMNKHKNVREEAFFISETADNFKILQGRNKKEGKSTLEDDADAGQQEKLAAVQASIE
ncbi:uncharacterized protein LOC117190535 isoform X1 [Drosophila miranda]|uniref:uncharacterized protein LOC117190535 isoform X1 n=1 Tax=Drosophila miranda TaxID=7229 RepID=UPI00143F5A0E|nr:uncharacterized protein LOC117190535 isoform X1 [Drosophila miranda]